MNTWLKTVSPAFIILSAGLGGVAFAGTVETGQPISSDRSKTSLAVVESSPKNTPSSASNTSKVVKNKAASNVQHSPAPGTGIKSLGTGTVSGIENLGGVIDNETKATSELIGKRPEGSDAKDDKTSTPLKIETAPDKVGDMSRRGASAGRSSAQKTCSGKDSKCTDSNRKVNAPADKPSKNSKNTAANIEMSSTLPQQHQEKTMEQSLLSAAFGKKSAFGKAFNFMLPFASASRLI